MAIILEGCDCTGKTTFANKLSEITEFEVVKGSSFEISELGGDKMFDHMMKMITSRSDIIIDRFLYSNLVYGKMFGYPMMNPDQYTKLSEAIDKTSLLVYLHAPIGVIQYRMLNRGDDMIKVGDVEGILEGYKDALYGDFRPMRMLSIDSAMNYSMDSEAKVVRELYGNSVFNF